MKDLDSKKEKAGSYLLPGFLVLCLIGVIWYGYSKANAQKIAYEAQIKELQDSLASRENSLSLAKIESGDLATKLKDEQIKNGTYVKKIDDIQTTVDTLTKLSQTDKELLQKYSKVFFLNENYVPSELTPIDTKYLSNRSKPQQIHDLVWPFLSKMLDAAESANTPIQIISAYRSFGTQSTLKASYKVTYGAGTANQFSAEQGYSEHQLGTALDFTTPTLGSAFEGFANTTAYAWLNNNAYRYGFVLSYPKNNTFYQFEPWHWRFVGIELATRLHNDNKFFYGLDQRDIDAYLLHIFNFVAP